MLDDFVSVVNCFQITTLVEDSQVTNDYFVKCLCCELLSDYYFSRRFTGLKELRESGGKL